MRRPASRLILGAALGALLPAAAHAADDVPLVVPHAGRLLGADDLPVDAPALPITFRLFDKSVPVEGEKKVWEGSCQVTVQKGLFTAALGGTCGTGLLASHFPLGEARFLELAVNGTTLAPRLLVGVAPLAQTAQVAQTARDAERLGGKALSDLDLRYAQLSAQAPAQAQAGSLALTGSVQAAGFVGSGAGLTDLSVAALSGKILDAQLASGADLAKLSGAPAFAGDVTTGGKFVGSGQGLTNLDATKLVGGVDDARLSANVARLNAASTAFANGVSAASFTTAGNVTATGSGQFVGSGAGLTSLNATRLTGTVPYANLPVGTSANTVAAGDHTHAPLLGDVSSSPATSCADLKTRRSSAPDGVYWVKPSSAAGAFQVYCDMTVDGGGWTLVWSNLRGGRGKVVTELQWGAAISTAPRYDGAPSTDLESFDVFTGLKHWMPLAPNGLFRYDWANDYGSPIDQRWKASFSLSGATLKLAFANPVQMVGTVAPGLYGYQGYGFTTYDRDNDVAPSNCAQGYTNTPWWYGNCWSGSINGGGEGSNGYTNGAYWTDSANVWGTDAGQGGGNGWMFVK